MLYLERQYSENHIAYMHTAVFADFQCKLPTFLPVGYQDNGYCAGFAPASECYGISCPSGYTGFATVSCPAENGVFALSGCFGLHSHPPSFPVRFAPSYPLMESIYPFGLSHFSFLIFFSSFEIFPIISRLLNFQHSVHRTNLRSPFDQSLFSSFLLPSPLKYEE